jgi:hypothetical protein
VEFAGFDYPGGIALDEAVAQVNDATPVDAVHIETTAIPGGGTGQPAYLAWFFQSPRLPDIANDRGNIMVLMELAEDEDRIRRVLLSLQTALLAEAEPGAESGGLGLTGATWGERYGDPARAGGFALEPSFDADGWIHTLVATAEGEAMPVEDARALVGTLLPPDAWTADTYSMPALDDAETVLRVVRWESQRMRELGGGYGSVLVFFPERMDRDAAVTERVVLATMR